MSHVATIDVEIKDLDALAEAAAALGIELQRGRTKYRWFGRHVGGYPLPEGFKAADLGTCEHVLTIPGDTRCYEIGVTKRRDGRPGFTLLWDFWGMHGRTMQEKIGTQGEKLKQSYAATVAAKAARKQGFRVQQTIATDGSIVLSCSK